MTDKKYVPAKWESKFLELYRKTCNVTVSADGAKINRETVYMRRAAHPEFAVIMDKVKEEAIEILEAIAMQRAKNSSDTLLIFLLKAHKPQMYKETQRHELSDPNGNPLNLAPNIYLPDVAPLPDDDEDQADG